MLSSFIGWVLILATLLSRPSIPTKNKVLSNVTYSLSNRYNDPYVNNVFADNILLTLAYMGGKVKPGKAVSWNVVKTPGANKIVLKPGETFAFHDTALDKYQGKVVATTNAHFNSYEGFKSDGWLVGDGVCHLASFIYVASKSAGLDTIAPTRHDFAKIPDVEKQDGVSIYYSPENPTNSTLQNLYITNNRSQTIAFIFTNNNTSLNIKVEQLN